MYGQGAFEHFRRHYICTYIHIRTYISYELVRKWVRRIQSRTWRRKKGALFDYDQKRKGRPKVVSYVLRCGRPYAIWRRQTNELNVCIVSYIVHSSSPLTLTTPGRKGEMNKKHLGVTTGRKNLIEPRKMR